MALTRNLRTIERVVRVVVGIVLIFLTFSVTGAWKPLSAIVGTVLILTASVAY